MTDNIKDFLEKSYQSEELKKSIETFIDFEELIDKIFSELPLTKVLSKHTVENRKRIYALLTKCHAQGHIALLKHIITDTDVESLVYSHVHGLNYASAISFDDPDRFPYLFSALKKFNKLNSTVDALILAKIVINGWYREPIGEQPTYYSLFDRSIRGSLKKTPIYQPNPAQKILAEAFVARYIKTESIHCSSLAYASLNLLEDHPFNKESKLSFREFETLVNSLSKKGRSISDIKLSKDHSPRTLDNIFQDIKRLLGIKKYAFLLLEKLELELRKQYQDHSIDLSEYTTPDAIVENKLTWPIFAIQNKPGKAKGASKILNSLLLALEHKHHINKFPNAPVLFAGFVDPKEANKQVQLGQVFEEFKYTGNPLHGSRSHRLQWHIILRAIDENILDLGSFTALDLVKNSVPNWWTELFDTYAVIRPEHGGRFYDLRSPHYLHSQLLLSFDRFPAISGCLRKVFVNTINEICAAQSKENPLNYSEVVSLCDKVGAQFTVPGIKTDFISHYGKNRKNINLFFIYPNDEVNKEDKNEGCIFYKAR